MDEKTSFDSTTVLTRGSVYKVRLACLNPGPKKPTRFKKQTIGESKLHQD
jgi:hypothetical protein